MAKKLSDSEVEEALTDMGKFKRPAKKNYTQKNIDHHMRIISKPPVSPKRTGNRNNFGKKR